MSKNPHLDVRQTKVDRVEMPVPSTGIFASPYYIKKVNVEWWKHISGIIHGLTELSAWSGDTVAVQTAVDEIHRFLIEEFEEAMPLDCDEVEDCLPNTSVLQISRSLSQMQNTQQNEANKKRVDLWDGETPQSINEDAPEYMNDNSQASINYLCVAVEWFVKDFQARFLDGLNLAINVGYISQAWGAFIATISGILSPMLSVAGGMVFWVVDIAVDEIADIITAFQDSDAIEEYICELLKAIRDRDTSYNGYIDALNEALIAQTPDTNIHTVAYWINLYCANDAIYAYFIDLLATAQECVLEDNCACIEPIGCGGDLVVFPDPAFPTSYTLPSYITFGAGTNIIDYSMVEFWVLMLSEEWFEIDLGKWTCITGMNFGGIFRQASGSGIPDLTISIDGVDVHSVSLNVGGGTVSHYPTWTGVVGRVIRIRNNSKGGASNRNFQVRLVSVDTNSD